MLFPTFEFFFFFSIVLILNWLLKRWPLIWRLFLLLASYYFYSVWDLRFLLILFSVSLFNFLSGIAIYKNFLSRKIPFLLSLIFNLSILGIFKYYDFFRTSAEFFLSKLGLLINFPILEIFLPIGLSFYIFKIISYNADIYSKKLDPTFSLLDFFIYVSFFPHLLSGPIMRAGDFLVQLKDGGAKRIENFYQNLTLIFLGLFKKLVISSYLVLNLTDNVFAVPENHSSLIIFLAIFAYSLVIYFDFSGYSDMAIGFAGLMGFRSPINFDFPYLASNLGEFWRKWHISLSNWVRDYIYIPLGGSRKGKLREYFNLMTAMVLMGFWHGAAVHFIFWGVIQGIGLSFSHWFENKNFKPKFLGNFLTFNFVSFGWIFFRSENIKTAFSLIRNLFNFGRIFEPFKFYLLFLIGAGFFVILFEKRIINEFTNLQKWLPTFFWFLFLIFAMLLILKLSPDIIPPFIYFGF